MRKKSNDIFISVGLFFWKKSYIQNSDFSRTVNVMWIFQLKTYSSSNLEKCQCRCCRSNRWNWIFTPWPNWSMIEKKWVLFWNIDTELFGILTISVQSSCISRNLIYYTLWVIYACAFNHLECYSYYFNYFHHHIHGETFAA